jgi:hypothetical protein
MSEDKNSSTPFGNAAGFFESTVVMIYVVPNPN